jgi:hydrogenase maturation protein HypF
MAEHHLEGPVLALTWDGTGLGDDGAAWGGELLLARPERFDRLATFRPIALPGGDQAIREPWRLALAAVEDAFDGAPPLDALPLFSRIDPDALRVVRRMIATRFRAPLAHGAGRAFDAVAALALCRPTSRYEGQLATALEAAADPGERRPYPFDVDAASAPWQLDLRPAYRAAALDVAAGRRPAAVAARLHEALVAAAVALVRRAVRSHGRLPLVLTGGCFANARLAEGIAGRLESTCEVYQHERVPPGDGGVALGQAVVADARTRRGEG